MSKFVPPEYYLNALGLCCSIGNDKDSVSTALFSETLSSQRLRDFLTPGRDFLKNGDGYYLGRVDADLPTMPSGFEVYDSRNNRLLLLAFYQIEEDVRNAMDLYGADRVAVVLGTSTSGIAEGENALFARRSLDKFPDNYVFGVQEIADGADFLASLLGIGNIAVVISTACSSSAKVFSHAKEIMDAGICDAAIVGGVDSLCHLTVNGFHSLGALSDTPCNPFSQNRSGISIGEGAALFLMTKNPGHIEIVGIGESSDGYSMTAPDPEGLGAEKSMRDALKKAGLDASSIAYVNLHGTATAHNDSMESKAVSRVFGADIPCSSSKSMLGHTLGASGAIEAALCWLMLSRQFNPDGFVLPHVWDGVLGDDIALNNFCNVGDRLRNGPGPRYVLSNSFAFGGSNASIILKHSEADDEL